MRLLYLLALPALAQEPGGVEFFEKKIRPVLAARCYACHLSKLKSPMGGLALDTREGTRRAVDGKLLGALRYANPSLQMPPGGKLPDAVIADFLDAIEQNRDPAITGEEALATQRVIDDIINKGV